jgi:hypothetical protein
LLAESDSHIVAPSACEIIKFKFAGLPMVIENPHQDANICRTSFHHGDHDKRRQLNYT